MCTPETLPLPEDERQALHIYHLKLLQLLKLASHHLHYYSGELMFNNSTKVIHFLQQGASFETFWHSSMAATPGSIIGLLDCC